MAVLYGFWSLWYRRFDSAGFVPVLHRFATTALEFEESVRSRPVTWLPDGANITSVRVEEGTSLGYERQRAVRNVGKRSKTPKIRRTAKNAGQ